MSFRNLTLPPIRSCDHAIELCPGSRPVDQRPYCYSHEQKNAIEKIISDMLEAKTLRPSNSPFGSLVILVKKKRTQHGDYVSVTAISMTLPLKINTQFRWWRIYLMS